MNARVMDLNADVGERPGHAGVADDAAIMRGISSVSVACGFHAGDGETMGAVCEVAVSLRKRIGAHVSYLDREGFGRRDLEIEPKLLAEQVAQQIRALSATALAVGGRVSYVKAHGALYNRAATDVACARAITEAIGAVDPTLVLLAPPGSEMLRAATAQGIASVAEGFADRAYLPDGRLAPRSQAGSLLAADAALAQAKLITLEQRVVTVGGGNLSLAVGSICLHSDTSGAAGLALRIRNGLIGAGVEIRPFT